MSVNIPNNYGIGVRVRHREVRGTSKIVESRNNLPQYVDSKSER